MSVTLDELVKMEGVVMAFEFTPDGQCTAHKNVTPEMAAMAARYCATVTMEFNTLARAFSLLPFHGRNPVGLSARETGTRAAASGPALTQPAPALHIPFTKLRLNRE